MIRFKDKIFEQWSICPATGEIFNSTTGEVQKVPLHQGRPRFKGMYVHQIIAHTFYGYRQGYVVHHLDENPLNNVLSNLVYLSESEHKKIHWAGDNNPAKENRANISAANKGKPLSEEHKEKISTALKGKILSAETCAKISTALKGKKCWHNASGEIKRAKESPGPEWLPGRKKRLLLEL